jgi:hypothetical protein
MIDDKSGLSTLIASLINVAAPEFELLGVTTKFEAAAI